MKRMLILFIIFTAVMTKHIAAFDLSETDIHGFVSQGFMVSDRNNYYAETENGSFQFNEMGINFSNQLSDRLRVGVQFFARDLGKIGNNEPTVDWAVADYRWQDWLGLRVGRIKNRCGFYGYTRDIDMLRTSIFLPQSVYFEGMRETSNALDGVGIYGYVDPEHRRQLLDIIDREGKILGFETQFLREDNSPIWVSLSARLVKDSDGNVLYFEGSVIDITEHKEKEKAELQRQIAEEANKKIMSSIRYAKSIQHSLLPNMDEVKTFLPHSLFIWEPRDIVGGDIFFAERFEDGFIIAVVDCTGHGVPGAFMTMIASSGLRKIIRDEGCHDPAEILNRLNYFVKKTLRQDTAYALSDDGLDAGICFVSGTDSHFSLLTSHFSLTFAGAKLPLFCVYNNELNVIKGDKQSLGYKRSDLNFSFTDHTVSIESGMSFYLFTDGFADQMGGEKRRRFGTSKLKKLLTENAASDFERQKELLLEAFYSHKGKGERQDDVTGVGFGF